MEKSRTGSSRGVYKRNGEIMAVPHAGVEASWAANEKTAARGVTLSTMKDSFKDPNLKAALTPYHPSAQRSRLPVTFANEAKPFKRFCQVRNQHTYKCAAPNHRLAHAPAVRKTFICDRRAASLA